MLKTARSFYIVCLRYAPGNWQHMRSFAFCLREHGFRVHMALSGRFKWMNREFKDVSYPTGFALRLTNLLDILAFLLWGWARFAYGLCRWKPGGLLLVMWHPLNFVVAGLSRILCRDLCIIAWLHEPYKSPSEKRIYRLKSLAIYAVEFCQALSLPFVDVVIVHSPKAAKAFRLRYLRFRGEIKVIPLQFREIPCAEQKRLYISFLGNATRAKGIDKFFEVVQHSFRLGRKTMFQLVTSSDVGKHLKSLAPEVRDLLRVVTGSQISDEQLREAAGSSVAVLALYRDTMQSGVIPVALMSGTPVIATEIEGLRQFLVPEQTAFFVPKEPTAEQVLEAIDRVEAGFGPMSIACRRSYLDLFDDRNWSSAYAWILTDTSKPVVNDNEVKAVSHL
ncbi:MAG: glycosyltransferase [Acidobacteriota bacterium]